MDELPATIGEASCTGFANSGEGASEISVVQDGNQAVQRQYSQRHVAARLVATLLVGPTSCGKLIDHALHTQGTCCQQADLACVDVSWFSDTCAIDCPDIFSARGQAGSMFTTAENDGCFRVIIRLSNEFAVDRSQAGQAI